MAPSIRGGAAGVAGSTGTGNQAITAAASPSAGDHIYIVVNVNNASSGVHPTPACTGFGAALATSTASVWSRTTLLGKIATGSEGTSFTITGFTGADAKYCAIIVVQDGNSSITSTFVNTPDASSNTTWSIPAYTTTVNDALDFAIVGYGGNNSQGTPGNLSSWGGGFDTGVLVDNAVDSGGSNYYAGLGIAYALRATAGSQAATSVTAAVADVSAAIRFEVTPAAAATKAAPPRRSIHRFFRGWS